MKAQAKPVNPNYKWVIAAVCFISILIGLGICSSSKGQFLDPITKELHLYSSLFSVTDTIRYATTAVINLFFAALVAKMGAKRMMVCGIACLAVSMLLYSIAPSLPEEGATAADYVKTLSPVYGAGFFLGLGLAWSTTTMIGYIVGKWFTKDRGTVMGVVLAANGLGNALSAQLLNPVIIGRWPIPLFGSVPVRSAYRLVAVLLAGVIVLLLIFFREPPEGHLDGEFKGKKRRGRQWVGIEWPEIKKKYYFYVTAVCVFLTGFALQSIAGVSKRHLTNVYGEDFAALIISLYATTLCFTKLLSGFSYDRIGLRKTMLICNVAASVGIFGMALAPATMPWLGLTSKIILAFAMPLETVMLPLIAADMFGEKCFTKVMGLFVSINTAGYAVGSPITNLVYDITGSYTPILVVLGGLMSVVAVVEQIDLHHAEKDREEFLAKLEAAEPAPAESKPEA